MPKLALKVDVDTLIGTEVGVPRLVEMLTQHRAKATFLFSLGPDHTGRAIKRVFRPGFLTKVNRTSVLQHYGLKTLLYGTLLPGPDIGEQCADRMRSVREAGFEVGIHAYDHVKWQDNVSRQGLEWTEREMRLEAGRFSEIFGIPAKTHGAAGWQMNTHALRLTQELGFDFCSDCRGSFAFIPVCAGEAIRCPQLPTTLPTLDEMIGVDGMTPQNVVHALLERSGATSRRDQVFTLHAELEGQKLAGLFEQLLEGWRTQGYELVSLRDYFNALAVETLPRCDVYQGEVPGRSGTLLCQGRVIEAA